MSEHAIGFERGYGEAAAPRDAEIEKLKARLEALSEVCDVLAADGPTILRLLRNHNHPTALRFNNAVALAAKAKHQC